MFHLDTDSLSANKARFATFTDAANCAVVHARQRGEAKVCNGSYMLLADFVRQDDGTVSVYAVCDGRQMVEDWAA